MRCKVLVQTVRTYVNATLHDNVAPIMTVCYPLYEPESNQHISAVKGHAGGTLVLQEGPVLVTDKDVLQYQVRWNTSCYVELYVRSVTTTGHSPFLVGLQKHAPFLPAWKAGCIPQSARMKPLYTLQPR